MTSRHPANRGKVMLAAWVDAPLRDHVRTAAKERGIPISRFIEEAVRTALTKHAFDLIPFG